MYGKHGGAPVPTQGISWFPQINATARKHTFAHHAPRALQESEPPFVWTPTALGYPRRA